jgi:ribosomal protein L40E
MSFFSLSSKRSHYRNGQYGSQHYKREGFLGRLFDDLASRSGGVYYDRGNYPHPNQQPSLYPNQNQNPLHNQTSNQLVCNKCNAQTPVGSKFCLHCGNKIGEALFCTACGEKLPADAKFCLTCGTKISG